MGTERGQTGEGSEGRRVTIVPRMPRSRVLVFRYAAEDRLGWEVRVDGVAGTNHRYKHASQRTRARS